MRRHRNAAAAEFKGRYCSMLVVAISLSISRNVTSTERPRKSSIASPSGVRNQRYFQGITPAPAYTELVKPIKPVRLVKRHLLEE